jgi:hypothetical protein
MWLETIAALMFIVGLWPLWLFVAIGWGAIVGCLTFVATIVLTVSEGSASAESVLLVPINALLEALSAAWSIPSWAWSWAKFEHPWVAAALGLLGLGMQGGSSSR